MDIIRYYKVEGEEQKICSEFKGYHKLKLPIIWGKYNKYNTTVYLWKESRLSELLLIEFPYPYFQVQQTRVGGTKYLRYQSQKTGFHCNICNFKQWTKEENQLIIWIILLFIFSLCIEFSEDMKMDKIFQEQIWVCSEGAHLYQYFFYFWNDPIQFQWLEFISVHNLSFKWINFSFVVIQILFYRSRYLIWC